MLIDSVYHDDLLSERSKIIQEFSVTLNIRNKSALQEKTII